MDDVVKKRIVVVGSGVIGLSIALQLKVQGGFDITIIARELAQRDSESRQFSSPWAGANWASTTADLKQQKRDEITFKQWQKWSKELSQDLIAEMPFTEYTHKIAQNDQVNEWRSKFLPNYRSSWVGDEEKATQFDGLTLDAPAFLAKLESELQAESSSFFPTLDNSSSSSPHQSTVKVIRAGIRSLSDVFQYVSDAQLVINATGLGSKSLKDVLDDTVYPIRGQTVLIKASKQFQQSPRCVMKVPKGGNFNVSHSLPEDQEFTYVIPRAKSGQVICGGCAIPNDWSTELDQEMCNRILQRCIQLVPELLEEGMDATHDDAWKSVEIISRNLGLRPARKDGMRLELETVPLSGHQSQSFAVLHAYGAGGGGYQSMYGIALEA